DPATFLQCKLDHEERRRHATWFALHRDLLRLRRSQAAFAAQDGRNIDGAVLGEDVFVLRFFADDALDDRLVIVALGSDLRFDPAPEPLVAPPLGCRWSVLWSSEEPEYGGGGTAPPESEANWLIPGRAALVLAPEPRTAGKGLGRMSTTAPLRRMTWDTDERRNRSALLHREWLLTNGLGGYASGTIAGVATRRYHGYLVATPPAPL